MSSPAVAAAVMADCIEAKGVGLVQGAPVVPALSSTQRTCWIVEANPLPDPGRISRAKLPVSDGFVEEAGLLSDLTVSGLAKEAGILSGLLAAAWGFVPGAANRICTPRNVQSASSKS